MNADTAAAPAAGLARPKNWLADFVLLAAIWGSSFLFMRIGAVEFGALPTAAVRVTIAALFLLPLVWLRGLLPELKTHWRKVFLVGVLNSGIPFACFAFALLSITTGLSSIINATVPMFGALIAWLWLRDKPDTSRLLGLLIGFAGVALLAWDKATFKPDASGIAPGWAVLACLLACVCYGISASYTKRYLTGMPPLVTAAGSQVGASLGLALPALWFWPARMPGTHAWLALLAVGVLCTGVAYIVFFRLIENAGPPRALSVTFVVPVFAVLYGVLLLGETVTPWMLLCAAIIVCGTALATGLLRLGR
ncbi:MAG: EamA family transporter [Polaromonas sp. 39-63-203]|uniref:DMT family transporter n=1 Tax=Polaromonas sp. TaxID=1869339 RepID=UPI000BD8225E|nr:DMT family transporter [Polaromonas sp.]OYY52878.1 MAG: EamA family transporter [Polaromonas sp. 35-63-240]OYY99357.1 MAG: EamA family transporter [Polaromonas sp. 28-63-22]OYZ83955.1 MAG: EamA family transporter [Polaromonas sp. 24-62-144]OZA98582.1 MAG: EamA family transporter [Polaromonas sp. 39-63-203]HQS33106.1 DMT family transporter [Polaromonas sp.]